MYSAEDCAAINEVGPLQSFFLFAQHNIHHSFIVSADFDVASNVATERVYCGADS